MEDGPRDIEEEDDDEPPELEHGPAAPVSGGGCNDCCGAGLSWAVLLDCSRCSLSQPACAFEAQRLLLQRPIKCRPLAPPPACLCLPSPPQDIPMLSLAEAQEAIKAKLGLAEAGCRAGQEPGRPRHCRQAGGSAGGAAGWCTPAARQHDRPRAGPWVWPPALCLFACLKLVFVGVLARRASVALPLPPPAAAVATVAVRLI